MFIEQYIVHSVYLTPASPLLSPPPPCLFLRLFPFFCALPPHPPASSSSCLLILLHLLTFPYPPAPLRSFHLTVSSYSVFSCLFIFFHFSFFNSSRFSYCSPCCLILSLIPSPSSQISTVKSFIIKIPSCGHSLPNWFQPSHFPFLAQWICPSVDFLWSAAGFPSELQLDLSTSPNCICRCGVNGFAWSTRCHWIVAAA